MNIKALITATGADRPKLLIKPRKMKIKHLGATIKDNATFAIEAPKFFFSGGSLPLWAGIKFATDMVEGAVEPIIAAISGNIQLSKVMQRAKKGLKELPAEEAKYFKKRINYHLTGLYVRKYENGDFSTKLNTLSALCKKQLK